MPDQTNEPKDQEITPDLAIDDPNTPSDILHGIVQSKKEKQPLTWQYEDSRHLEGIAKHPNTSAESLTDIYNITFPKNDTAEPGKESIISNDRYANSIIEEAFKHPNMPVEHAQDYVERTYRSNDKHDDSFTNAINHPSIPHEYRQEITNKIIEDPEIDSMPDITHKADYLHKLWSERENPEPEEGEMTESQKLHNTKVRKIDSVVLSGLPTAHHTAADLEQSVNLFSGNQPVMLDKDFDGVVSNFIKERQDLTSAHLDKIFNSRQGAEDDKSVQEQVLEHANVDPKLLSKIALHATENYAESQLRSTALQNPRLPKETKDQIIESITPEDDHGWGSISSALLRNQSLDANDLLKVYNKGATNAIYHDNAPEGMIEDFYNKSDKKADSARSILKAKNVPASVIKDIITKNKNMNVVEDALKHSKVDKDILDAALKRKSSVVQELAAQHPLVAKDQLKQRIKTGQLDPVEFMKSRSMQSSYGDIDEDMAKLLDEKISEKAAAHPEGLDNNSIFNAKNSLATSTSIPEEIRNKNKTEIINAFKKYPNNRDITTAVLNFADKGDIHAQQVSLSDPNLLPGLDLDNENFGSDFTSKAFDVLTEKQKEPDHHYGIDGSISQLLSNPNLPEEKFDKAIQEDRNFLLEPRRYMTNRYSYSNNPTRTVFDKRYGMGTEEEKKAGFEKLYSLGANYAIALSKKTPNDIWSKSFDRLTTEEQEKISKDYNDSLSKMTPELFDKVLTESSSHPLKSRLLNSLNPKNPNQINSLKKYISSAYTGEDTVFNHNYLHPTKELAHNLPTEFWNDPASSDVIDHAINVNANTGILLATQKSIITENPEYLQQVINKDPANATHHWETALNHISHMDTTHRLNANSALTSSGGKPLDFLANLPGDAEAGYPVRTEAVNLGLISPELKLQILNENPENLASAIDSAGKKEDRSNLFQSALHRENLDSRSLDILVNKLIPTDVMPTSALRGYQRTRHIDEDQFKESMTHIDKLTSSALSSDDPAGLTGYLLNKVFQNSTTKSFTVAQKKQIASKVLESIKQSNLDTKIKNNVFNQIAEHTNEEFLPRSLLKDIAKQSAESNDIDELLQSYKSNEGSAAKVIEKKIAKILKNPESLSSTQLRVITSDVVNEKTDLATIKNLTSAIQEKAAESPEMHDELESTIPKMLQSWVLGQYSDVSLGTSDTKKADFVTSNIVNFLDSPNDHAAIVSQKVATMLINSSALPIDKRVKLFNSMPASLKLSTEDLWESRSLPVDMVNDSEVLLSATHGWKLRTIVNSSAKLDKDSAEQITNRVMASTEPDSDLKTRLAAGLMVGGVADNEDIVKLFRSYGPSGALAALEHATSYHISRGNSNEITSSKLYVAIPHAMDYLKDQYNDETKLGFGISTETSSMILKDLNNVFEITHGVPTSVNPDSSFHAHAAEANSDGYDLINKMKASLISKIETSKTLNIDERVINNLMRNAEAINSSIVSNGEINKADTLKSLDAINFQFDIAEAYDKQGVSDWNLLNTDNKARAISYWLKAVSPQDGDWPELIKKEPMVALNLSNLKTITNAAIESVDFNELLKPGVSHGILLNDMESWASKFPYAEKTELTNKLLDKTIGWREKATKKTLSTIDNDDRWIDFFSRTMKYSPESFSASTLKRITDSFSDQQHQTEINLVAAEKNLGGKDHLERTLNQHLLDLDNITRDTPWLQKLTDIVSNSEYIDDTLAARILDKSTKKETSLVAGFEMVSALASNPTISSDTVRGIWGYEKKSSEKMGKSNESLLPLIAKHPNISKDLFDEVYNSTKKIYGDKFIRGKAFNPAFANSKFGGQLFRSLPLEVPKALEGTVNPELLVKTAEHSVAKDRLNSALQVIPPEGITWVDFKKKFQKLSNYPEVKKVFLSKQNQPIMPEDIAKAMPEYDGNDFHITYSNYDVCQIHRYNNNNLVMQLNTSEHMENQLSADPKLWAFYQMVQASGNHTSNDQIGGHPTTPHLASWVRIDTDAGKKGYIIEEFQSDFGSHIRKFGENLIKDHPNGLKVKGQFIHAGEIKEYLSKIEKALGGWYEASLKATIELAKKQGCEYLYLHGIGLRATLSGFESDRPFPVYANQMYDENPRAQGWEEIDYSEYPKYSERRKKEVQARKRSTKCWRLRLK